MIKRGDRKLFKEFVSFVKVNNRCLNKIRLKLNKLLESNIEINQKGYMGRTLLHTAIQLKSKALLKMFIMSMVMLQFI